MLEDFAFDTEVGGAYPRDLYRVATIAERITPAAAQSDAAREHYREHGWLSVRDIFSADDIATAMTAVDDLARGRIEGFRGVSYESAVRHRVKRMSPDERYDAVRKLMGFAAVDPRMAALTAHPVITAIVRNLFDGAAGLLIQDMALLKPPLIGREKPWHQDLAFFDYAPESRVVGVWIALDPATVANGCMHVLDRGHAGGPQIHFRRRDFQICDTAMLGRGAVAFPLEPGDAMFFDGLVPHGTPANDTPERRRALQFHYIREGARRTGSAARLAIFGEDGKDVAC